MSQLAARWAEQPEERSFGPLAEALRKAGALEEALAVVRAGLESHPDYLPGHLVLGRICADQQDWAGADAALRGALGLDPTHPAALEGLAELADAMGRSAEGRHWREALAAALPSEAPDSSPLLDPDRPDDAEIAEPDEFVLTESLAALYHRQGHLEKAMEVYAVLIARTPGNAALLARREALREELLASQPCPYDAGVSGGTAVATWLSRIAAAAPEAPRETGYDAFFESRETPRDDAADFEAFQAWLRGLGR